MYSTFQKSLPKCNEAKLLEKTISRWSLVKAKADYCILARIYENYYMEKRAARLACFFVLLISLVAVSRSSFSQDLTMQPIGVSYYAIQAFSHSQCSKALNVFEGVSVPSLAMLWGTFGTSNACVDRFLAMYGQAPNILEIHITNNTCLRGRICRRGEVVRGVSWHRYNQLLEQRDPPTINSLTARIKQIVSYIKRARGAQTRVMLSTGLEDNYSTAAYRVVLRLLEAFKAVTPFEIVRSPFKINKRTNPQADLLEGHGFTPSFGTPWYGRCLANNDGDDIVFRGKPNGDEIPWTEVPAFINNYHGIGCLVFLWWSGPQGLSDTSATRITPQRRFYDIRSDDIANINGIIRAY